MADVQTDSPDETPEPQTSVYRSTLRVIAVASAGLLLLATFYTLYAARAIFMPLVVALLFNFLLSPVVRFLGRLKIPAPAAAALVLLSFIGVLALGVYQLSAPAGRWLERLPQSLENAEYKIRDITRPVEKLEQATQEVEKVTQDPEAAGQQVQIQEPTMTDVVLNQTQEALIGLAVFVFLLYFLLASGDLFLRKFIRVLPLLRHKRNAVEISHQIERELSAYLFTVTLINIGLGVTVGFGLYLIGMPSPLLWGAMAGFLNYLPYLGPVIGVTIVGLVALVSFDSTVQIVAAPALYFAVNALEGYLVTPFIVGRSLRLNPVAIFISIMFWGWIWGIPGALLAVPLLVMLKIVSDNVSTLSPMSEFLGN